MKLNDVVSQLIAKNKLEAANIKEHRAEVDRVYQEMGDQASMMWEPADEIAGFKVRPGACMENGANEIPGGVNFTIYSLGATSVTLHLFHRKEQVPFASLPIPTSYKMGHVWSILVYGLNVEDFEYAYTVDGPQDPQHGLLFDKNKYLLDPYAKAVVGQRVWGEEKQPTDCYHARVVKNNFHWDTSKFPNISMEDSIIYEMHVRGFTKDSSSDVTYPGTFAGIIEKIPYLKDLGVTAVELMPIFEFDEVANGHEYEGKHLLEYWGYNTVAFFAPNTSYAASAEYNREGNELKQMIQLLKENGIEVILDVVFNHTAEGNEDGPYISFKGLDNNVWYMLTPDGSYYNFSGCGNTMNCNHPIVQNYIVECLRYWVTRYHVDGFRFDLASILGRDELGRPMEDPPLLKRLAFDPILGNVKLIAEAWDAGGMYQVGSFPKYNRWAEWNGKYRDSMRDFLKGNYWSAPEAASRISGSYDLYSSIQQGYVCSVNFLTCHDGFTLYDLYAYNNKHNEANGWDNTDGSNDNRSWNCGIEGETTDPRINQLRFQMMRNAITVLMCSRGTPMIYAGDEFANTQYGNNNCYCQDNEYSWLDWNLLKKNKEFYTFYKNVIHFRKEHLCISRVMAPARCGLPNVAISSNNPDDHDITSETRLLQVVFAGYNETTNKDDIVCMIINPIWEDQHVRLPALPEGFSWGICIDTADRTGHCYRDVPSYMSDVMLIVPARSVMVFTAIPSPIDFHI